MRAIAYKGKFDVASATCAETAQVQPEVALFDAEIIWYNLRRICGE